jgi:hypothetical protein
MSTNPELMRMMAQSEVADRQRAAGPRPCGTRRTLIHRAARTRPASLTTTKAAPGGFRGAIGWFLVAVGLRLAVPRPRSGSGR